MLAKLIGHLEWADARALAALRVARGASPKAEELYAHILGAEHTWLARIAGRPSPLAVWPRLSLDECEELARDATEQLRALAPAPPAALQRSVRYTNSAGAEFESTVEDMLLQLLLHGVYHRGQIAQLLRQAGAEPSPTDYIAWVRGAPAATRVASPSP